MPVHKRFFIVLLVLAGCATSPDQRSYTEEDIIPRVHALPSGTEKRIAIAVLNHGNTTYRIDRNGYPAWRWRGENDIGACVHIDPKTGKPYLETQYPRGVQSSAPKYIDLGTDGEDWQCRIHVHYGLVEYEKNWQGAECQREGRALANQLLQVLR